MWDFSGTSEDRRSGVCHLSALHLYEQTNKQTITTNSQERSIPDASTAVVPSESKNERLYNDQTEYIPTFPGRHVCLFNFQSDGRTLQSGLCLCKRRYAGWEDKGWDRSYMCEMPDSHVICVYKNDHKSYVDAKELLLDSSSTIQYFFPIFHYSSCQNVII